MKCTNLKFSSCKYTWPLGSCGNCLELQILIFPSHFAKLQSEAPSLLLIHWSQLQDSVAVGGALTGGQSGHPGELWEFCDCNRYCSPYGGCARAHLLTLGFKELQTSDGDAFCYSTSPRPVCSLIPKQQEAGSLA